ncbi:hypothetical protein HPP92_022609 [Vanilla planifolia]|uniref:Uncharacterized protein n=1 Tax=Vanilla planifolia TaxID=51239 RepID=A0A835PW06_VANPL|nr:hypothetical protein HPP92_022893 [Vanilla planifolia]KAG0459481.1 hypothetical protein HPP92_022609 [Vanilla planifolia]
MDALNKSEALEIFDKYEIVVTGGDPTTVAFADCRAWEYTSHVTDSGGGPPPNPFGRVNGD